MHRLLRLWFSFDEPVGRRAYLLSGLSLITLKLGGDVLLVWSTMHRFWSPLDYARPLNTRLQVLFPLSPQPSWLPLAMAAWTMPFLWIGASMTLRRAADAGWTPWTVLGFFLPWVNWLLMMALAVAPSRPRAQHARTAETEHTEKKLQAAIKGIATGVLVGAISIAVQIALIRRYTAGVFLGTPFVMGAAAGWFYNRPGLQPGKRTAGIGALTICIAGIASLLFAIEGALCVVMALPLAIPIGVLGALAGRAMRGEHLATRPALLLILALPASAVIDRPHPPLREVASSVEVGAPPERVWPHVLAFADLAPPSEWLFRLGIAYPVRARIQGQGPGAVRMCEFSTGAFVEPITAWDPPRRLAFDVTSQPLPMREWSPYPHVHPPHLEGTMLSRRGEFRLVALPGGRTRLEGSTWYQLDIAPHLYWWIWSDFLLHQIHGRVLRHIKAEVESG